MALKRMASRPTSVHFRFPRLRRGWGNEVELGEAEIEVPADPGVGGGVSNLSRREVPPSPVGRLCPFGDAAMKEDSGEIAKAGMVHSQRLAAVTQLDEAPRRKVAHGLQLSDVIPDGDARFDNVRITQQGEERSGKIAVWKLKQINSLRCGELNEGRWIRDPFSKSGARLRVEPQDLLSPQFDDGIARRPSATDQLDWSFVACERQLIYFSAGDACLDLVDFVDRTVHVIS